MSSDAMVLTPELEQLLREVAAEPRSRLLRAPRKKVERTFLEASRWVSASTTGLTSVEREIVLVYREEVALLLRQAAWAKIVDEDRDRQTIDHRLTKDEVIPNVGWAHVRSCASALRGSEFAANEPEKVIGLLESLVRLDTLRQTTATELAAAAYRLVPTDSSRIYAAMSQANRGAYSTAIDLYVQALQGTASPLSRMACWNNVAYCLDRQGSLAAALVANRKARLCGPEFVPCLYSGLVLGLDLGADIEVLACAEDLITALGSDMSSLTTLEHQVLVLKATESGARRELRYETIGRLRSKIPDQLGGVVDALL